MVNKKIKIAIATHKMVMGGIEKSLIDLCYRLIEQGIDVTVYLDARGGELYDKLPQNIKIIGVFEEYASVSKIIRKCIMRRDLKALRYAIQALCENRFHGDPVNAWVHTAGYLEKTCEEYDYAFAYGSPVSFSTVFVKWRVRAKKNMFGFTMMSDMTHLILSNIRRFLVAMIKLFVYLKWEKNHF